MNSVNLIGRLASDPDLRYVADGKAVANFSLAVQRTKDLADFFEIVAWEKTAEFAAKLSKGNRVGVSGRLQQERWEKDGVKRSAVKVVAFQVDSLEPRSE